ncbi:entericidin A/B family lipoprotein [Phenylobacterium montanum]|uniref:Entericidin A/B family lipoprotein n=1 Tax=Phenylobacterium montanum TaxID=2823693 RepID=A0A975FXQ0_9CAUL|nr:entericidin A/B family lipoprotein [Caulobacter sp. S6]QUD86857.1 entericidin A/B family lipoprotein [Caulobacter sp. S6]
MRKMLLWTLLAASLSVAACNTVKGAGQDVSAAGHAVSDTASDAQHH